MPVFALNIYSPPADKEDVSVNASKPAPQSSPSIWLDGEPVLLPSPFNASLALILGELENLAARQQRVLASVRVDGHLVGSPTEASDQRGMQRVEAESMSLAELSRSLAEEARRQVRELRWSMERAVVVVLINEPPMNRRLWQQWQLAVREPLTNLGILRDLWGARLAELAIGGHSLDAHLEELGRIAGHVELILLKADAESLPAAMILSDVLERNLVPWLRRLEDYLGKLHEQTLE